MLEMLGGRLGLGGGIGLGLGGLCGGSFLRSFMDCEMVKV